MLVCAPLTRRGADAPCAAPQTGLPFSAVSITAVSFYVDITIELVGISTLPADQMATLIGVRWPTPCVRLLHTRSVRVLTGAPGAWPQLVATYGSVDPSDVTVIRMWVPAPPPPAP